MWTKIYFALLGIGIVVAGFFAFYACSWLQSIGEPNAAWEAFNYHKRSGVYFVVGWTALLLVVGNVILWTRRNPWALWISHLYFVVSTLTFLVWLHLSGIAFCKENSVCLDPSRAIGPLLCVVGSLALSGIIFADQFVVLRMLEKMYGVSDVAEAETENSRSEETES